MWTYERHTHNNKKAAAGPILKPFFCFACAAPARASRLSSLSCLSVCLSLCLCVCVSVCVHMLLLPASAPEAFLHVSASLHTHTHTHTGRTHVCVCVCVAPRIDAQSHTGGDVRQLVRLTVSPSVNPFDCQSVSQSV